MVTVDGGRLECVGVTCVEMVCQGRRVKLDALVVAERPLGLVDVLIGMSGIVSLGGVSVITSSQVSVGGGQAGAEGRAEPMSRRGQVGAADRVEPQVGGNQVEAEDRAEPQVGGGQVGAADRGEPQRLKVEGRDFSGEFDGDRWTVRWKWADEVAPEGLANTVEQYAVPARVKQAYDRELRAWIDKGWLVPHREEEVGRARALIPLMAVDQPHKGKVRPVLDFRELNSHISVHAADADVCAEQLRRWRQHGASLAVVDLKHAYLQLHVDRRLWPYQTVVIDGQKYCLGRLGFGLNVAPLIMKAVVQKVLDQDERIKRAVLAYVDDLLVDENTATADEVIAHFARFGLECKAPQRVTHEGMRALGLRVTPRRDGGLQWERDNELPAPPSVLTRRSVFQWCGTLTAHLPVAGWLRPAVAWLKRVMNDLTDGWDDPVPDEGIVAQIKAVHERVCNRDPARGRWDFCGGGVTVWADASAIATGVVLEDSEGSVMEDACWLRSERESASHINMAELDAAIKGINLAILWGAQEIALRTDSATVCTWIRDAVSGRARLRSKAQGEMLIRRRLGVVAQLVEEFGLRLDVRLVTSDENVADALTRVPRQWLQRRDPASDREDDARAASQTQRAACATRLDSGAVKAQIASVHGQVGHPGVRRTLWYARREMPGTLVRRADVRDVLASCDVCQSIDPAPQRWRHGTLAVQTDWERLSIDVTHVGGSRYLSIVDCGPSRFGLWRLLRRETGEEITGLLEQVFWERGAPAELLLDNATEFRGRVMRAFAAKWRVALRFRAAYEAGGNGIVDRHPRTIKVMVARQRCSVQEAVHRYNVTPREGSDEESAPAAGIYRYPIRDLPVDLERCGIEVSSEGPLAPPTSVWKVGDPVWIRRRNLDRCGDPSKAGLVTRVLSDQVIEVDGMPWHVRNVRRRRDSPNGGDPHSVPETNVTSGGMGGPGLPGVVQVADGDAERVDEVDADEVPLEAEICEGPPLEAERGGEEGDAQRGEAGEVERDHDTGPDEAPAEEAAAVGVPDDDIVHSSPFAHVNRYAVLADLEAGDATEQATPCRRARRGRRRPAEVYGTTVDSGSIDLRSLRRRAR